MRFTSLRSTRHGFNISHICWFRVLGKRCAYTFIWRNKSIFRQPRYEFFCKRNVNNILGNHKLWVEADFWHFHFALNIFA